MSSIFLTGRLPPVSHRIRHSLLSDTKKQARSKSKKRRILWTAEEQDYLRKGVQRFGVGRWKAIMKTYPFNRCRSTVDLKDKWRNMMKRKH